MGEEIRIHRKLSIDFFEYTRADEVVIFKIFGILSTPRFLLTTI